jgi:hypothetical protein
VPVSNAHHSGNVVLQANWMPPTWQLGLKGLEFLEAAAAAACAVMLRAGHRLRQKLPRLG